MLLSGSCGVEEDKGTALMTKMGFESQLRIMRVEALYCHDAEPLN